MIFHFVFYFVEYLISRRKNYSYMWYELSEPQGLICIQRDKRTMSFSHVLQ